MGKTVQGIKDDLSCYFNTDMIRFDISTFFTSDIVVDFIKVLKKHLTQSGFTPVNFPDKPQENKINSFVSSHIDGVISSEQFDTYIGFAVRRFFSFCKDNRYDDGTVSLLLGFVLSDKILTDYLNGSFTLKPDVAGDRVYIDQTLF